MAAKDGRLQAEADLAAAQAAADHARATLEETKAEVDRLLLVSNHLTQGSASDAIQQARAVRAAAASAIPFSLPKVVSEPSTEKARQIGAQPLLSPRGKDLLTKLVALLLAGELPIVYGPDACDFVAVAGALISPGRTVGMEADPTLISIEDVWARPGSGSPTVMASAATAAESGAVLVVVRSVERSGSRFWMPALAEALRGGSLPRGLLVCCTVTDAANDELDAVPSDFFTLEAEGVFAEAAYLQAPAVLTAPGQERKVINPGERPTDLVPATAVLTKLGVVPSVGQALRIARVFVEAKTLLNSADDAERITIELGRSILVEDD
jgi:nucleotide-binding universal stress UspA family protein